MGNDGGKQVISVAPVLFQSPGEAVRELLLCVTESQGQGGAGDSGMCVPAMTCLCFQFLFQDSCCWRFLMPDTQPTAK